MKKLMLKNCKIDATKLKDVIALCVFGSYHEKVFDKDRSDIDIMILLDLSDMDIKQYRHELSGETFDFNMDHDLDIICKKYYQNIFHMTIFILLLLVSLIILLVKSY